MTDTKQAVKALREAIAREVPEGWSAGEKMARRLYWSNLGRLSKEILPPILDRLEELENPWRPMSEAPRDGTEVLLCKYDDRQFVGHSHPSGLGWLAAPAETWVGNNFVSHWMPLPPIPTKDPDDG